ncbi:MAG: translation initiation factor IF-2 [Eubacteriales bacterium]|nr:translation initiation factor IF-2 [Eubacteriales bacterium]
MAKIKVHELAKELEIKSKDILSFLQEKGLDVKAPQSSIEGDAVEWVKKKFASGISKSAEPEPEKRTPAAQTQKTEEKAGHTERMTQVEKAEESNVKAAAQPTAGQEQKEGQAKPHKKSKTIIVVNNPQNSRMRNNGSGNNDRRNNGGRGGDNRNGDGRNNENRSNNNRQGNFQGNRNNNGNNNRNSNRVEQRPLIRPLTKPSQPVMPDEKLLSRERAAKEAAQKAAAAERAAKAAEIEAQKKEEAARAERLQNAEESAKAEVRTERVERQGTVSNAGRSERAASQNREYGRNDNRSDNRNERSREQGTNQDRNARPRNDQSRNDQNRYGARQDQNRGDRNGSFNRSQNTRPGQERTQGNGQRRDQNRPGYNNTTRDNQGYNRNAGPGQRSAGGNRPGTNSGRPQTGDGRQNNNFRKPAASKGFTPEAPAKDTEKRRDDRRLNQQDRDKKSRKDAIYEDDSAANLKGRNKAGRFIKPEPKPAEPEEVIKVITLPETITIKELAEKMKMQPAAIIKKLFLQGKIVTVNQEISYEDAENIAIEYDIICEKEVKVDVIEELLKEEAENEDDMITRPPVICVMGHVDHGKTSLLDAIRKTNVTDREAGGITQHIGAYTVQINGQKITFLDTPGHEAFTAMRMRGANSTDIAVLVVAADDGVMPQTVEAINHAKAAGIEIIVAVNKIDKPNANVDRVKQELTEYGLIAEDWGGSTVFVPVSAKTGEGLQNLLEMILLTAEVLELKANPDRMARGLVIEAELDKGRGPVARVLVQKGTLHVGDFVSAGSSSGKVRAMIDDKGRRVKEAGPSTPVEILGLSDVPDAGDVFLAHESDKEAKSYAAAFIEQNKEKKLEETKSRMSLDDLFNQIQEGNLKELNLIVKADVQGSVEAVKQSLLKLSNDEVVVKCIHGGVGAINESDVTLASASNAIIIGFNVRPDATAKATAELENVDIRLYRVIYQAIEDIEAAMKGMLDPVFEEKVIGHAEVRQIFKASAIGNIAGSYVLDGVFQRGCKVRISREGEQIYEGALASLKRFKDDVKEVKAGFECGLVFEGFDKMQELDIVEAYIMVEVPR